MACEALSMDDRLAKPAFKTPCTRCGYCCAMERCWISIQAFGEGPGPCPGLTYVGSVASCGVLEIAPAFIQPKIAFALGIGSGCDSPDDDESVAWNRHAHSAGETQ
jgi:hypothetical protein